MHSPHQENGLADTSQPGRKPAPYQGDSAGRCMTPADGAGETTGHAGIQEGRAAASAAAWIAWATLTIASAERSAMLAGVPSAVSTRTQRTTAQRRWWPLVARMAAWPHSARAVMVASRGIAGFLGGLARDVDQRPTLRMPGPVNVRHAMPLHIWTQHLAWVHAIAGTLQRRAAIRRNAPTAPLDHGRRLAVHQASDLCRPAEMVDDMLHAVILGPPSIKRKPDLAAVALG